MSRAEVAALVGFGDGPLDAGERLVVLGAQKDVAGVRLDGEAGDDHALEHQVRVVREEEAVLEAAGLHLVAVADDVLGPRGVGAQRHGAPLAPGGVAGAAAAAQAGVGDELRDGGRLELPQGAGEALVAAGGDVVVEVRRLPVRPHGLRERPLPAVRVQGGAHAYASRMAPTSRRRHGPVQVGVDHHRRAPVAGAEADDGQQREAAVRRGLAEADAELRLDGFAQLGVAQRPAGEAVADEHDVAPDRPAEEHVGEGRQAVELLDAHAEVRAEVGERLVGEPAPLPLQDAHRGRGGGAPVRVVRQDRVDLPAFVGAEAHRSTSPITKSRLPRIVTRSAISYPWASSGSTCRWGNEGVRILVR